MAMMTRVDAREIQKRDCESRFLQSPLPFLDLPSSQTDERTKERMPLRVSSPLLKVLMVLLLMLVMLLSRLLPERSPRFLLFQTAKAGGETQRKESKVRKGMSMRHRGKEVKASRCVSEKKRKSRMTMERERVKTLPSSSLTFLP